MGVIVMLLMAIAGCANGSDAEVLSCDGNVLTGTTSYGSAMVSPAIFLKFPLAQSG